MHIKLINIIAVSNKDRLFNKQYKKSEILLIRYVFESDSLL